MSAPPWSRAGRGRLLFFLTLLHLLCHGLLSLITPLYYCLQADFDLSGVQPVTALATLAAVAFAVAGLGAGWLADRIGGRPVAGWGLMLHGAGLIGLGNAATLPAARVWVVIAAVGAAGYHPVAAKHLVTLFPRSVGRAIGVAAVGAGLGFWLGPRYAGWRAEAAGWCAPHWISHAWRAPMVEAGLLGVVVAALYLLLTDEPVAEGQEAPHGAAPSRRMGFGLLASVGLLGLALVPRDFATLGLEALNSLFLQGPHHLGVAAAGSLLAAKGLVSLVTNPLATWLSDRGNRLVWWAGVLLLGALFAALVPLVPAAWAGPALVAHGVCLLASYPILESAVAETVPARLRGRAAAVLLATVGLPGAFAAQTVGGWVDRLGLGAAAARYVPLYLELSGLMLVSLAAAAALGLVRRRATRYLGGV